MYRDTGSLSSPDEWSEIRVVFAAVAAPRVSLRSRGLQLAAPYSIPAAPACRTTLPQSATSRAGKRASSAGGVGAPGIMPMSMSFFWLSVAPNRPWYRWRCTDYRSPDGARIPLSRRAGFTLD